MPTLSKRADTIVLVHGFWVTPRSWEHWITAMKPVATASSLQRIRFEFEVEALNRDSSPVERLTVPAIMAHLEAVAGRCEASPILIGHSAGGAFVQPSSIVAMGRLGWRSIPHLRRGACHAAVAAQIDVSGAEESAIATGQWRSRTINRATCSRTHSTKRPHAPPTNRCHVPASGAFSGQRTGEFHPRAPGDGG